MKRAAGKSKEATHDRIAEAAARAIRRTGYNGTGVAELTKDAGRTHRGFYAHCPTRRIKEMIDLVARQSSDWGRPGTHERALVTVATMVGALVLARAVDDSRLSDALRKAALKHLTVSPN